MKTLVWCIGLCLVLGSNPARCDDEEEDTYLSEFGDKIDRATPVKVRKSKYVMIHISKTRIT